VPSTCKKGDFSLYRSWETAGDGCTIIRPPGCFRTRRRVRGWSCAISGT
jgi:hypothetical protein